MKRALLLGAAVTTGATFATFTGTARADEGEAISATPRYEGTEQNFEVELRFSPYTPQIDSEAGLHGKTPYADVFGTGARVEAALEVDWQALRIPRFGTIGPGVGVGYTSMSALATFSAGPRAGQLSGENTSLSIYPLYAVAVARADVFERDAHVPLVPYAKLGVGYALWRASNDAGTSQTDDVSGKGHTFGIHGAVGLSLQLNALDPVAARNLDNDVGINNTYFFGEVMFADYQGIGQTNVLRVGTNTWVLGLAFEF